MTIIPLLVPCQPPEWLLLDLQGDISLRRIAQSTGGSSSSRQPPLNAVDKPALNAIDTYANLELGVIQSQDGRHQLRIGNHLLDCQLTTLKKPLLVCRRSRHSAASGGRRQQRQQQQQGAEGGKEGSSDGSNSSIHCVAVVRHKVSVLTRPAPIIVATPGPMPALH